MQAVSLRHQQPASSRKLASQGASRMAAKEPMSVHSPKVNFGFLKALLWPVLLVVLGYGTYESAQRLMLYADWPLTCINMQGNLTYISQQAVQQRIASYVTANFFTVDLEGMRTELEQMPWIAHAEVRRVWPNQVVIRLEEQFPVARWGDEALLNNQGQAFTPRELANYRHLPQLSGPQRAQQQVMQQYHVFSQILQPMGLSIVRLTLRERGIWFLTTGAEIVGPRTELLLGRDHLVERMRRFIAIYEKTLKKQITNIARIDLRYASGLTVRWREPVAPTIAQSVVAKN